MPNRDKAKKKNNEKITGASGVSQIPSEGLNPNGQVARCRDFDGDPKM